MCNFTITAILFVGKCRDRAKADEFLKIRKRHIVGGTVITTACVIVVHFIILQLIYNKLVKRKQEHFTTKMLAVLSIRDQNVTNVTNFWSVLT